MFQPNLTQVFPEVEQSHEKTSRSTSPLKQKRFQTTSEQEFLNLNDSNQRSMDLKLDIKKRLIDQMMSFKVRCDSKGVPITKGSKNHKIRFKKVIKQVIIVENWKIYNYGTEEDEQTCPCTCSIQ